MSGVLRIVEEGNSRLFLIADQGPEGERTFVQMEMTLQVLDHTGAAVWLVPLDPIDWALIQQNRGHWLECKSELLVRDTVIVLRGS